MKIKYIPLFTLVFLTACGTQKDTAAVAPVVEETIVVEEAEVLDEEEIPTERPVYRQAETILTDLVHTKLEVNFDWKQSRMNGVETLTAKPHFYPSDSLILDAKGMEIHSVKMGNLPLKYTYMEDLLKIKLDKVYKRGQAYTLSIAYTAKPEERETGGSAAITSDKGLYFINPMGEDKNVMPQIWTQGETEASSVWFPTIDAPNTKTSQEIFITVDNKYQTLSNGKLVSAKKNSDGTRTDHWKQELAHAPYLFMMGVGEFKVVKDYYSRPDGSKMEVNYYVEPEWEAYADDIFGETPEMIAYFSKLLKVEYPWDKYHQIVVRDYVSGAMENTGAVIFGDFVYKNDRELLDENDQSTIAHELFHHWFGDLVTCESWSNLTLNESFANYSQYLWDEHRYGLDEAEFNAEREADGYFQSAQMQGHHNLVWFDYEDKEQMFDGHSYNKGGRILHMLRSYLGDEAFFEGISNYLNANKFKAAEFHHLRLAFEEVCGEDLNWFFNQWYLGSGHPVLELKYNTTASMVELTVDQVQNLELSPIYRLPVQVEVNDANGKHVHKIVIDELSESFSFPYSGELKNVLFDKQQMLLAKIREDKPREWYINQYSADQKYKVRKQGLMNGATQADSITEVMVAQGLNDSFWDMRTIAIEKVEKLGLTSAPLISKLNELALKDPNSRVRLAALAALKDKLEASVYDGLLLAAVEKDSSYSVVSSALSLYGKSHPEEAVQLAKKLENEHSSQLASGVAKIYGTYGTEKELAYFENIFKSNILQGFDKLGVMGSFTYFLTRQDDQLITEALPVYQQLKDDGNYYVGMFLPQNIDYLKQNLEARIAVEQQSQQKLTEEGKTADLEASKMKVLRLETLIQKLNTLTK